MRSSSRTDLVAGESTRIREPIADLNCSSLELRLFIEDDENDRASVAKRCGMDIFSYSCNRKKILLLD